MNVAATNVATMNARDISARTRVCFDAWEAGDVEPALALYTKDVVYSDTRTRGKIVGTSDLRRYLTKFFDRYDVKFFLNEGHRILGLNGEAVMWDCTYRRRLADGGLSRSIVMQRGIVMLSLRGELIDRHEAMIDLSVLKSLEGDVQ